jgi:outer membrane murein-binding lipoprotein Lpp
MTDRDILELIATQVGKLTTKVDKLTTQVNGLTKDMAGVKATMATKDELAKVKAIVIKIEHDHGQKLGALFDEHKLISEKLDLIEAEVSRHEEIILRRIK